MLEVAEGVKYLHSEGIIHGDLHGVRVPILCLSNRLIALFTSVMSSSIPNFIAKSLISDRLDILKPLLHDLQQHLLRILLHLSSLACAPHVVCSTARDVREMKLYRKEGKQWKQMFTLLVAFIMQCVWIFT